MATTKADARQLATAAGDLLRSGLDDLDSLRRMVAGIYADADAEDRLPTVDELRSIEPGCVALAASADSLLEAAGFNAAEGSVEAQRYIAFVWSTDRSGHVRDASPITDRSLLFHYEYEELDWFLEASRGKPSIGGPIVDYGGSNDYTLTLALPVFVSDRFVGAVSGDVALRTVELRLVSSFVHDGGRIVLVTGEGRVVLSNDPELLIGSIVRDGEAWSSVPCRPAHWRVLWCDPGV